jgi:hypothetical protein
LLTLTAANLTEATMTLPERDLRDALLAGAADGALLTGSTNSAWSPDDPAAELRGELLAGTASYEEIAAALDVTVRTVYRMNLPSIFVAGKRRAVIAEAREYLMRRRRRPLELPPPRGRGRPRKDQHATT